MPKSLINVSVMIYICSLTAVSMGQDTRPYYGIGRTNVDSPYHGYARNLSDPQDTLKFCKKVAEWKKEQVVEVNFIDCNISDEAAILLGTANFRRLSLIDSTITTAGAQHLLSSNQIVYISFGTAPMVEKLDLSVLSSKESRLVRIDIHQSLLDDDTLLTLGEIERPFSLWVTKARITGRGLAGLRGVPNVGNLNLFGNPIDDDGLSHLPALSKLIKLDLSATKITDAGLAHLSPMPELTDLNLYGTAITGEGLLAFAASKKLGRVDLQRTKVDDESFAKLPTWPELKNLELQQTKITDRALEQFVAPKTFQYLFLEGEGLTAEGLRTFSIRNPHVSVYLQHNNHGKKGFRYIAGVRTDF